MHAKAIGRKRLEFASAAARVSHEWRGWQRHDRHRDAIRRNGGNHRRISKGGASK
jgi:hypothetical protein